MKHFVYGDGRRSAPTHIVCAFYVSSVIGTESDQENVLRLCK